MKQATQQRRYWEYIFYFERSHRTRYRSQNMLNYLFLHSSRRQCNVTDCMCHQWQACASTRPLSTRRFTTCMLRTTQRSLLHPRPAEGGAALAAADDSTHEPAHGASDVMAHSATPVQAGCHDRAACASRRKRPLGLRWGHRLRGGCFPTVGHGSSTLEFFQERASVATLLAAVVVVIIGNDTVARP